jgi:SepF-like predicted cell division protein (DUF552 family)
MTNDRFLRSRKKRAELWLKCDGKCNNCKKVLPKDWHADHFIPYCVYPSTDYKFMQALCPKCNLKKGDKILLLNKIEYEELDICESFDISKCRKGQKGAINCIKYNIVSGNPTVSICLPTRYGKSDVIRLSSIELIDSDICSSAILVSPSKLLRDQLVDPKKIKEMCNRYKINPKKIITWDLMESFYLSMFQNDEYFTSMTTQMFATNARIIGKWVKKHMRDTSKPPIFYIDETHTGSEENVWGSAVQTMINAGAKVVLLTATPYRCDGKNIPGFKCEYTDERSGTSSVYEKCEDGKIIRNTFMKKYAKVSLIPDYEHTFKEAWDEEALCRFSKTEIDIIVTVDDITKEISEFTSNEIPKYLAKICKNKDVISVSASLFVDRLNLYKKASSEIGGIIFCGNDNPKDEFVNKHAKEIETEISKFDSNLDIKIATMNSENDAKAIIENFKKGNGDVLIVKQMASLGLDISRLKVALDLSSVRTPAAYIQKSMRIATPHNEFMNCTFITPGDIISSTLFENLISGEGGEIRAAIESTLIASEKIEEEDMTEKSKEFFSVDEVSCGATLDLLEQNKKINKEDKDREKLDAITTCYPNLQKVMSDVELLELSRNLNDDFVNEYSSSSENDIFKDNHEIKKVFREDINKLTHQIAHLLTVDKDHWVEIVKKYHIKAKRFVNCNEAPLDKIQNIERLKGIKSFLEKELKKIKLNSISA